MKRQMSVFLKYLNLAADPTMPPAWSEALQEAMDKIKTTPEYKEYFGATNNRNDVT